MSPSSEIRPLRPFFKHFGSKWLLSRKLPPPAFDTIIEPFAGGAGYSLRYGHGRTVVLVDADPAVVALWSYLIRTPAQEIRHLPVRPVLEGADIREMGLDPTALLLIQRWLTPQGSTSNWRITPNLRAWAETKPGSTWSVRTRDRIATQVEYIRHWQVCLGDYRDAPNIEATWDIDAPYQNNGRGAKAYGSRIQDYGALASWCRSRQGQVFVHEQAGAAWLPFRPLLDTPTGRIARGQRTRRVEALWSARETP